MPYEFFFSYSRSNSSPYLDQFFEDLCEDLRGKLGLPPGHPVGFRDKHNLELGAEWEPTLLDALQQSKVMLALGSPAYFQSEYCGKEWAFFRARMAAAKGAGALPPLLKSVVWIPIDIARLPARVGELQLLSGAKEAVHNAKGLHYMLKQIVDQRSAYNDFIDALSDEIRHAGDAHPLPPLPDPPALRTLAPAFAAPPAAAAAGGGAAQILMPSGPKHVHFIYVAADPHEFGDARPPDPYVDSGAGDWRPFFPADPRRVNPLLQQVAARDELAFSSTEVPFGDDLIQRIDAALKQRQIVVIVIDPWSLHWDAQRPTPRYLPLLQQLDARLDYHWCVLVPWNDEDAGIAPLREQVAAAVHGAFDRHATLLPNPLFYREDISTAAELQAAVAEALTRLKEEVKKRADVARPMPAGPARPAVTGPSSAV